MISQVWTCDGIFFFLFLSIWYEEGKKQVERLHAKLINMAPSNNKMSAIWDVN